MNRSHESSPPEIWAALRWLESCFDDVDRVAVMARFDQRLLVAPTTGDRAVWCRVAVVGWGSSDGVAMHKSIDVDVVRARTLGAITFRFP